MVERGVGHRAHQAERSATMDEADAVLGWQPSESGRRFDETGVVAGPGAAIDADSPDFVHTGHVALQRKRRQAGCSFNGIADLACKYPRFAKDLLQSRVQQKGKRPI